MPNHVHAIMIKKAPSGPLVHCKVIEMELGPNGASWRDNLKLDLLMWWYYSRYHIPKYDIETAGFQDMKHFLWKHPECEKFLKKKKA